MTRFLPVENVKAGMVLGKNVFQHDGYTLIALENTKLTDRLIEHLKSQNLSMLPIITDGLVLDDEPALLEIKPMLDEKLRKDAVDGIRRMFLAVNDGLTERNMTTAYQNIKELETIVDQLVDSLNAEAASLVRIADLKSYDEYTYHHSLSVAVLSIAIGQAMGFSDEDVRVLGRCGMLHDIGKILVPLEIINKPAALNESEFSMIKKHPLNGYDYLVKINIGDETFRQVVLCHHEKVDGTGYPNHLKGDELSLMSRIISVADVYDAVTSYRSYRPPMPPSEAVELLMSEVGRSFDYNVVLAFINKIEMYPINTCLELSNKRRGIVTDNRNTMRPCLKMLDTGETVDLMNMNNLSLVITRVLDGWTARSV